MNIKELWEQFAAEISQLVLDVYSKHAACGHKMADSMETHCAQQGEYTANQCQGCV